MGFGSYFFLVGFSLSLVLADSAANCKTDALRSTNETADHCCVKVDIASRQIIDTTGRYKYCAHRYSYNVLARLGTALFITLTAL